jgi:hypothetical protein
MRPGDKYKNDLHDAIEGLAIPEPSQHRHVVAAIALQKTVVYPRARDMRGGEQRNAEAEQVL